jgi:hypothetical protein
LRPHYCAVLPARTARRPFIRLSTFLELNVELSREGEFQKVATAPRRTERPLERPCGRALSAATAGLFRLPSGSHASNRFTDLGLVDSTRFTDSATHVVKTHVLEAAATVLRLIA